MGLPVAPDEALLEGVGAPVPLPPPLAVTVAQTVALLLTLPAPVAVSALDEEALAASEGVGVAVAPRVKVAQLLPLPLQAPVPLPDGVLPPLAVAEAPVRGDPVAQGVGAAETLFGPGEGDGELLEVPAPACGDGVSPPLPLPRALGVAPSTGEGDPLGVNAPMPLREGVPEALPDPPGPGEKVGARPLRERSEVAEGEEEAVAAACEGEVRALWLAPPSGLLLRADEGVPPGPPPDVPLTAKGEGVGTGGVAVP